MGVFVLVIFYVYLYCIIHFYYKGESVIANYTASQTLGYFQIPAKGLSGTCDSLGKYKIYIFDSNLVWQMQLIII